MRLLFVILLAICTAGCGASLKDVCAKTAAGLQVVKDDAQDAAEVLAKVRQMVNALNLPADKLAEIDAAYNKTRTALQTIDDLIALSQRTCTAGSVSWDTFIEAWNALEPLVLSVVSLFAAAPDGTSIPTPAVVLRARGL
jgi:hypothetical protein